MKMKERFHAICRFLTMVSQGNHRVLFWLLGSAFAAATLPYLSLFFLGANFEFTACKVVPRLSVYCCRLSAYAVWAGIV